MCRTGLEPGKRLVPSDGERVVMHPLQIGFKLWICKQLQLEFAVVERGLRIAVQRASEFTNVALQGMTRRVGGFHPQGCFSDPFGESLPTTAELIQFLLAAIPSRHL